MARPLLTIMICLLTHSFAFAGYITAYLDRTKQSYDKPTHIVVAGVGMELGMQLQLSAVSKAKRYHELYPDHQIFLVAHKEDGTEDKPINNKAYLTKWGFITETASDKTFSDKSLMDQLAPFKQIASLDFYTHNSPHYGFQLESKYYRLTPESRENRRLKGHFLPDAYAILHGCNTGFIVAPSLAKLWEIPVAGTLASSGFEYLSKDGQFYFSGAGGGGKANVNDVSFNEGIKCAGGACTRMKPENGPYRGIWGNFEGGGLNFFKFFCVKNDQATCFRTMAKSLINSLSVRAVSTNPSFEDYKDLIYDYLCTSASSGKYRSLCKNSLEQYLRTKQIGSNGFRGKQIQCTFKECYAKVECMSFNGQLLHHTCKVENNWTKQVDTLEREYEAYLKGWELL